jgi:hypothetical protein
MNAYRKNSHKAGTFTSDGYVVAGGRKVEYETVKEHSGVALMLFLVPAVLLIGYIITHLA